MLVALILILGYYSDSLLYGLRQGYGQFRVLWGAVAVEKAIASGAFTDEQIQKIHLIAKIRRFAFDSLGLRANSSYTKIYDQKGKPLIWLVVASEKYRLRPKTWTFPIAGTFSYKGFFDQTTAIAQAARLSEQGYDTLVRPVSAWSTLGWLADPILSDMLRLSEGELAELIIHELTHGTIYLKNSVEYNESLASFIGKQGAKLFLEYQYGKNSPEKLRYERQIESSRRFVHYVVLFAQHLDHLYQNTPADQLAELKRRKIAELKNWVAEHPDFSLEFKERFAKQDINNAYLYSFLQYNAGEGEFEQECEDVAGGDLVRYIRYLRQTYGDRRLFW